MKEHLRGGCILGEQIFGVDEQKVHRHRAIALSMVAARANSLGHYLVPLNLAIRLGLHLGKLVVGASNHDHLNAQALGQRFRLLSRFAL